MTVLLAPSLWQEAYGMVVTEAILRGIPVIVSDQGGLSEAACGCPAAVVPVQPMQLPEVPGPSGPAPSWQARVLPEDQELAGWVQALQRLLGRRDVYEGCSSAGRDAALRVVQHQGLLLEQMVVWLGQVAS
jgi:glycosyltransferase involved in cell wall biosynthesis